MKQCCINSIDNPKRIGRAHYVCNECGKDITLWWYFNATRDLNIKDNPEHWIDKEESQ